MKTPKAKNSTARPEKPIVSNLRSKYPLIIISLKGSEEEMGRQYGQILNETGGYQEVIDFYPTMAETLLMQGFARHLRKGFLTKAIKPVLNIGLNSLFRQRPEQFTARSNAALEAISGSAEFSKYINIMDLFQNSLGLISNIGLIKNKSLYRPQPIPACSATMAWGQATTNGHMLHARNFDFPGFDVWDDAPSVVFCHPDDGIPYGFVSARGADVPGVSCFNAEGITITFHTRLHKQVGFDGIGAVDLGHTLIKNARTIDEVIKIASGFKIASTWGIDVSSAKEQRAVILETTRRKLTVIEAKPKQDYLLNTNHYYCQELQGSELATSSAYAQHSRGREMRMQQIVDQALKEGGIDVKILQRMLGDNYDGEDLSQTRAMGSTLAQAMGVMSMVVDSQDNAVYVSAGRAPTGWGPYAKIDLDFDLPVGYNEISENKIDTNYEHDYAHSVNANKFEAFQHYKKAAKYDMQGESTDEVLGLMQEAVKLDESDLAYRFLLGSLNLEKGQIGNALKHFEIGLSSENASFRRGQMLYWAAMSAQALGKKKEARHYATQLKNLAPHGYLNHEVNNIDKDLLSSSKEKLKNIITSFMLIEAA